MLMKNILDSITENFKLSHLLILISIFLIFIALLLIIHGLYKQKKQKLNQLIKNKDTLNHLKIDLINKKVYIFSIKSLENAKTISLNEFLDIFDNNNKKNVYRWLVNQLNQKKLEEDIKEFINFNKQKKTYTKDILLCTKNSIEQNTLFVEYYSAILSHKEQYLIKADYEIERCFFKLKRNSITNIGTISFFYTDEKKQKDTHCLDIITYQKIIQIILKQCNKKHLLTQLKNGDLCLIALNQKNDSRTFFNQIISKLTSFFEINNINHCSFTICAYQNKGDKINFNDCIKKTNILKKYLLDNQDYTPKLTYFYDGGSYPSNKKIILTDRIKKAIQREEFLCYITPFFNTKDGKIKFFKLNIEPTESSLLTTNQIENYVYMNSLGKDYLNMIFNKIKETFNENPAIKTDKPTILLPISLSFIDLIIENITYIPNIFNYNIILSINNEELNTENSIRSIKLIRKAKDLGLKICLEMTSTENPKEDLTSLLDYALFNKILLDEYLKNKQIYFLLTNIFKYFSNKKVQIIAENIDSYSTLETLIYNKGIILAGKCFELDNKPTFLLSKKIASEIKAIYDKYY